MPFFYKRLTMAKKELTTYDKIELVLYKSREEASVYLTDREMQQKDRWMLCVSKMMENPAMLDSELVIFLTNGGEGLFEKVSTATAYRDMAAVRRLVGNIKLSSKEWYRHLIVEACKKGIEIAIAANDASGIAANADKIGKYTRVDKDDDALNYDNFEPPVFEPSDDVTLLGDGFKEIPNLEEERAAFRALFKNDKNIQDALIIEESKDDE